MEYKELAIAKLITAGFTPYLPLVSRTSFDYDLIIEKDNVLATVKILPVSYTTQYPDIPKVTLLKKTNKRPSFRSILLLESYCISCPRTRRAWLIPHSIVADIQSISLKSRYDEFLLLSEYSVSTSTNSEFRRRAAELADQIKAELNKEN
jgi:hypothetical protein